MRPGSVRGTRCCSITSPAPNRERPRDDAGASRDGDVVLRTVDVPSRSDPTHLLARSDDREASVHVSRDHESQSVSFSSFVVQVGHPIRYS